MIALHAFETQDARANVEKGRKLSTWETSSLGRSVRKSRARVGVSTECNVRRTDRGQCWNSVSRKWDCSCSGRVVKWFMIEGSDMSVANDASGLNGACGAGEVVPLDGAVGHIDSGVGEPRGDGKGDGGAAALTVDMGGGAGAGLAFFRGGEERALVSSTPSIMFSLCDRFLPYRSSASAKPTTFVDSASTSRLSIAQPFPLASSCSSCISSSVPSPSRKVARVPPGKTSGNCRSDFGKGAL